MIRHNSKHIVFDFETESANLATARPWQFAYMYCQGKKVIKKEDLYIWWDDLNISEGAKRITGFDQAKYERLAKPAEEVLQIAEKLFSDKDTYIVGHNILGFDVMIYNVWRTALGKKVDFSFNNRILDTLCLAKAEHLGVELFHETLFEQQIGMSRKIIRGTRMTLGALCKRMNIDIDESKLHDAMIDIQKNKLLFDSIVWKLRL